MESFPSVPSLFQEGNEYLEQLNHPFKRSLQPPTGGLGQENILREQRFSLCPWKPVWLKKINKNKAKWVAVFYRPIPHSQQAFGPLCNEICMPVVRNRPVCSRPYKASTGRQRRQMRLLSQKGSKCLFPRASSLMRVTQAPTSKSWAVECLFSYPCPRVRHLKVSTQFLPDKIFLKSIYNYFTYFFLKMIQVFSCK